jgi:hypothetical protein
VAARNREQRLIKAERIALKGKRCPTTLQNLF